MLLNLAEALAVHGRMSCTSALIASASLQALVFAAMHLASPGASKVQDPVGAIIKGCLLLLSAIAATAEPHHCCCCLHSCTYIPSCAAGNGQFNPWWSCWSGQCAADWLTRLRTRMALRLEHHDGQRTTSLSLLYSLIIGTNPLTHSLSRRVLSSLTLFLAPLLGRTVRLCSYQVPARRFWEDRLLGFQLALQSWLWCLIQTWQISTVRTSHACV